MNQCMTQPYVLAPLRVRFMRVHKIIEQRYLLCMGENDNTVLPVIVDGKHLWLRSGGNHIVLRVTSNTWPLSIRMQVGDLHCLAMYK